MSITPLRSRTPLLIAGALTALSGTIATSPASAQSTDPVAGSVVLHMSGTMKLTLDKNFQKTVKKAKAKVQVRGGAKLKGRTITLTVDNSTTVSLSPALADIIGNGSLMIRRKDGRKVLMQDVALRLRDGGADLGATLRGKPERQLAALTISPSTAIEQTAAGYQFIDLQMLVTDDLVKAARKAHLKGFKAGALLGLLNVAVRADVPSLTLPGLDIPGLGSINVGNTDLGNLLG